MLAKVQAYTIARRLGTLAWADTDAMAADPRLAEVATQLVRAIGSIAAQIAEGYSRRSRSDRIRYFEYALGSTDEAISWYHTALPRLDTKLVESRLEDLVSIRRLLLVMIRNERAARTSSRSAPSSADNRRK
ncbi:MAG: four helix bundle protein [Gemmatimonadaceae bacterium]|nr:four helix bundle protein [Gemmatimonadaceae bacterium]